MYDDALEVTDVNDMLDYIYSLTSMSNINNTPREELKKILESNMTNGSLRIPKDMECLFAKIDRNINYDGNKKQLYRLNCAINIKLSNDN